MRIVISTGGTGGHIFPALQTASVLRERGHQVVFIGSLGLGEEKVRSEGFDVTVLNAKGLTSKSFTGLCSFALLMLQAIIKSLKNLRKIRPDKVIGFGGYGSFAVVLAARLLNIPTMIHEQNVVPGKANRFLAKCVKRIAISFPETRAHLQGDRTVWTGCPCHQQPSRLDREAIIRKYALEANRQTILVLGGSQGSQRLNEIVHEVIAAWSAPIAIQLVLMTGKKEYAAYAGKYKDSHVPVKVFEFINPIEEAYAIADVVIARSGAATVSELGYFAIPSIFIPYPLADGHQKYNAQILSSMGLAQIIEQKELTTARLTDALSAVLTAKFDKDQWRQKTTGLFKEDPAKELAVAIENL